MIGSRWAMRLRSVLIGESGPKKSLRLSPFPLGPAPIRCSVGCHVTSPRVGWPDTRLSRLSAAR